MEREFYSLMTDSRRYAAFISQFKCAGLVINNLAKYGDCNESYMLRLMEASDWSGEIQLDPLQGMRYTPIQNFHSNDFFDFD
jgi:hypothetical protein